MIFQSFNRLKEIKEKHICNEEPELSSNTDSSEQVPIGTIHMSLGFTVRPFPFFEFLHEVLHTNLIEGVVGEAGILAREGPAAVEKGRSGCVAARCARTHL